MENDFENNIEPEEPEIDEPEEQPEEEVEVNDAGYKLETIPDKPEGYDAKIEKVAEPELLDSFKDIAFKERVTQGQFAEAVKWWDNKGVKVFQESGVGDELVKSFHDFAVRHNYSQQQVDSLKGWFEGYVKKVNKQLKMSKEFSHKASGRYGDDGRAAQIARLRSSRAYCEKGNTPAERKAHKQATDLMLKLTGAKK